MHITFGLSLDGRESGESRQTLGNLTCGPMRFIQVLETRLGLKRRGASASQRVAELLGILQTAGGQGETFYSRSLQKDAFAVAETLLGWRDSLIEAGWDGQANATDMPRLRDLAVIEAKVPGAVAPGLPDRLALILKTLEARNAQIESLTVVEAPGVMPTLWRRICDKLKARYEDGSKSLVQDGPDENTDLGRFRAALVSGNAKQGSITPQGDGSILLIKAFSEIPLAGAVAQIMTQARRDGLRQILVSGDHALPLEQALRAVDEPALGLQPRSRARPIPQMLALALRLHWDPLDPRSLLEFLTHPVCPVPGRLRRLLAAAVVESPGVGGQKWIEALQKAKVATVQLNPDNLKAQQLELERIDECVADWLQFPRFDPQSGAPGKTLAACCARVAGWAGSRAAMPDIGEEKSGQFKTLASLASEMAGLLQSQADVRRTQLERLLQQVSSVGWPGAGAVAELGHADQVADPAAILAPADVVIWWGVSEPRTVSALPWSAHEIKQWQAHGVQFVPPETAMARDRASWLRPVLAARKRLVLVTPRMRGGEPVPTHPLQTRLVSFLAKGAALPEISLDQALAGQGSAKPFHFEPLAHRPLPPLRRWWKLSSGTQLGNRELESYTSAEKFIYSPYAWVLRYKAGLKAGPASELRLLDDRRQNGILIHRLVNLLLAAPPKDISWLTASREELSGWIGRRWKTLLEQEGANLLLPGKRADAAALRQTAELALWQLLQQLRSAKVTEAQSELELPPAAFAGGQIAGTLDLSVKKADGMVAVVDMKYGGASVREKELKEGRPLQLAVYGHFWSAVHGGAWPAAAFYILTQKSLIAWDRSFFPEATIIAPPAGSHGLQGCWDDFVRVWQWRREQLDQGWIELTVQGTEEMTEAEGMPSSNSPCPNWVAADDQDQYNDFDALTGWGADA